MPHNSSTKASAQRHVVRLTRGAPATAPGVPGSAAVSGSGAMMPVWAVCAPGEPVGGRAITVWPRTNRSRSACRS